MKRTMKRTMKHRGLAGPTRMRRDPGTPSSQPLGHTNGPPPSTTMGDSADCSAAAAPGPDARAPPAASPGTADAAEGAPGPQATCQPEAETCTVWTTGGTGHTEAGGQRTTHTADDPPVVVHEERTEGAAEDANPPQPATAEECVNPGFTTSPAREGMHGGPPPGASKTEDILALIFNETAPTAGQGPQTDEHLHDDESFAAFMAACRDGPPPTRVGINKRCLLIFFGKLTNERTNEQTMKTNEHRLLIFFLVNVVSVCF